MHKQTSIFRAIMAILAVVLGLAFSSSTVFAQASAAVGASGASTPTYAPGEIGTGSKDATAKLKEVITGVIPSAANLSQTIRPEADKLAGGLAVITLVLAFVRFAASHHPATAWANLFEELAVLGIFASIYLGYVTFAPAFYYWFGTLAKLINNDGANAGGAVDIINVNSQMWDAVMTTANGVSWTNAFSVGKNLLAVIPLLFTYVVLAITSIVYLWFFNVGQVKAAAGIVMGQIAFALGFSSFTRGWFQAWLDYMITAGMYTVVAAILNKLVTQTIVTAIANAPGVSTAVGSAYVLDLSLFVFMVSFEIPKIAGMFSGGSGVSGGGAASKAAKLLSGGAL
jgi:hypothetical protein